MKKIEIINADSTFANSSKHPDYLRLINNVSFMHNNIIMYCDSAYYFADKDKIESFGNIRIIQGDSIKLTGNKLTYFGLERNALIQGNVIFEDPYITLKTSSLYYNSYTNIAYYAHWGALKTYGM